MRLEAQQVAVVTGGASGIGLGLARGLAARGLSIVLADIEDEALDRAAADLASAGVPVHRQRTDVGDADQVEALATATLERFGRVDVVCNNAGVLGPWAPMWELDVNDWAWTFRVNLWGVVHGIRSFVPHLVAQGSGHVVNTASLAGLVPLPGNGPYCATKHAVVGLTETLRAELDLLGSPVGTTVVCPGAVTTKLAAASRNRPPELAPVHAMAGELHPRTESGEHLEPDAVAAAVIEAIEADRLHVLPNPGSDAGPRARVERLLADMPEGPT